VPAEIRSVFASAPEAKVVKLTNPPDIPIATATAIAPARMRFFIYYYPPFLGRSSRLVFCDNSLLKEKKDDYHF
jgi:hypothetical protein